MFGFQEFIRGCVIDPSLEKKVHALADDTRKVVRQVHSTLNEAQQTVSKLNNIQNLFVLAGLGLIVAGFMAGSMSAKRQQEDIKNPAV